MFRDRFAPSPNGLLHLGNAFSALTVWDGVQRNDGAFILRIEDIDTARSRPEYESAIFEDLEWLGLEWPSPAMRQSDRMDAYWQAITRLAKLDICYPCGCTRSDIRNALAAPQEGQEHSDGPAANSAPYPGLCRNRPMSSLSERDAIRLDMQRALELLGGVDAFNRLNFDEVGDANRGRHNLCAETLLSCHGDLVIARKDVRTSYHLAVVVDDAAQGISQITRGEDLFGATGIHRLLYELLELPVPVWNHHRLIRDEAGNRLAKRRESSSIQSLRKSGLKPNDIRRLVGLLP